MPLVLGLLVLVLALVHLSLYFGSGGLAPVLNTLYLTFNDSFAFTI
jgi:hypothetical protein